MTTPLDEPWARRWRSLQAPLSFALGAGILIFEMVKRGEFHPELIIVGAGLVGLPLVSPKKGD